MGMDQLCKLPRGSWEKGRIKTEQLISTLKSLKLNLLNPFSVISWLSPNPFLMADSFLLDPPYLHVDRRRLKLRVLYSLC